MWDELAETVRFHEWRYYTLNEPILSDTEYDFLFKALKQLNNRTRMEVRPLSYPTCRT
ncbi:MAG: hypothetical protein IPO33_08370 [Saprospiraceae bacterium]|nr:hypothetical protein [Candidatus Brachybacter algidus]